MASLIIIQDIIIGFKAKWNKGKMILKNAQELENYL